MTDNPFDLDYVGPDEAAPLADEQVVPPSASKPSSHVVYYPNIEQGSIDWMELRRGKITASVVKGLMTPSGRPANNDKVRQAIYELAAQRISGFVEDQYVSHDMMRGTVMEAYARDLYAEHFAPVEQTGFVETTEWTTMPFGCSPDGLVGNDGGIEIKCPRQKSQVQNTIRAMHGDIPPEYMVQVQANMLITGRQWWDFVTYCGGLNMVVTRVLPDAEIHQQIIESVQAAERQIGEIVADYRVALLNIERHCEAERIILDGEIRL